MEKCITLGDKQITIRATAGVLVIYKEQFGTEYMEDTAALEFDDNGMPMTEEDGRRALTIGGQLLWAMAKAADDKILPPIQFYEDIGSFDADYAYSEAAELFAMSCDGAEDMSSGKSNEKLTSENLVTSALLCKMSYTDLCKISVAMALNIINQYCAIKSGEEVTRKATQEDFDNF